MQINWRDAASGTIFIAIGVLIALTAAFTLQIGSAFQMGPGFFPLSLGILLILIGAIVAFSSIGSLSEPIGDIAWRGIALVLLPPMLFGLTVRGLGLAPSIAMVVALSSAASRKMSFIAGLALTVGMTAFCVFIFGVLIGLPLPLIGPWISGWSH